MTQPMDDLTLPLPEPAILPEESYDMGLEGIAYYTADQMREYARKAVEAERAVLERKIAHDLRQAGYALVWTARGYRVMDLGYVSAQPAVSRLIL